MKLRIDSVRVRTDPDLNVYRVEVASDNRPGLWPETFGSERDLEIFLRGVEATFAILTGETFPTPFVPAPETGYIVGEDGKVIGYGRG